MARDLDGAGDRIDFGDINAFDGIDELTLYQWKWNDNLTSDKLMLSKLNSTSASAWSILLWQDDTASVSARTNTYSFDVRTSVSDATRVEGNTNAAVQDQWQCVIGRWKRNTTNGHDLWVDGTKQTETQTPCCCLCIRVLGIVCRPMVQKI